MKTTEILNREYVALLERAQETISRKEAIELIHKADKIQQEVRLLGRDKG